MFLFSLVPHPRMVQVVPFLAVMFFSSAMLEKARGETCTLGLKKIEHNTKGRGGGDKTQMLQERILEL